MVIAPSHRSKAFFPRVNLLSGLVSYWPLTESSGTRSDFHAGNNLTDNNTVGQATGISDKPYTTAADMVRANNEYLNSNSTDFEFTDKLTVCAWIKIDSIDTSGNWIINKRETTETAGWQLIVLTDNKVYFNGYTGSNQFAAGTSTLSTGTWYFVHGQIDGLTLRVGVNGVWEDEHALPSAVASSSNTLAIGTGSWNPTATGIRHDGLVQGVGIWKRALNNNEIAALYNGGRGLNYPELKFGRPISLYDGLMGHWPLTEASGSRSEDHGGHTLTDNNTVGQITGITTAPYSTAADFIATNVEYLSYTHNGTFSVDSNDVTYVAWVKYDSLSASGNWIVNKRDSAGPGWQMQIGTDGKVYTAALTDVETVFNSTQTVLSSGVWYFIHGQIEGNKLRVGVNGVWENEFPVSGSIVGSTSPLVIGNGSWSQNSNLGHDGGIQAVSVWNRALSAREIAQLYNGGAGLTYEQMGYGSTPPLIEGLVSFWPLYEASGTRYDIHGSNDLTDNNTVTQGVGNVYATAADFEDANGEYLSVADNTSFDFDSFTICAWVKLESLSGDANVIACKWVGAAGNREFALDATNASSRFRFYVRDASATTTAVATADTLGAPSLSTWYFVVGYFKDGVEVGISATEVGSALNPFDTTAALFSRRKTANSFLIGELDPGSTNGFDGLIGPVLLWNRVLSTEEVLQLYADGKGLTYPEMRQGYKGQLIDGLVSYWKLHESDTDRFDSHGPNHLTDNNTVLAAAGNVYPAAADFELANLEYLSVAHNESFTSGDITACGWIKFESLPGSTFLNIFTKDNYSTNPTREFAFGYNIATSRFELYVFYNSAGGNDVLQADTFGVAAIDTLYFFCIIISSTHIAVSINNGSFDQLATTSGPRNSATTTPLLIGGQLDGATPVQTQDGLIGPVQLYNRVLSTDEITKIYNEGAGRRYEDMELVVVTPELPAGAWAIYDANVGITKDVSDGVTAWADQSGNGNDKTVTPAAKPLWESNQVNGSAALTFTLDSSNYIHTGANSPGNVVTCFMVMRTTSYGTNKRIWLDYDNTPYVRQDGSVDGAWDMYDGGGFTPGSQITVAAGWGIQMWMFNGANSMARFNKGTPVTGTLSGATWNGSCFGSFVGSSTSAGFQLAKSIIFNSAPDIPTQNSVFDYLANEFNLTL